MVFIFLCNLLFSFNNNTLVVFSLLLSYRSILYMPFNLMNVENFVICTNIVDRKDDFGLCLFGIVHRIFWFCSHICWVFFFSFLLEFGYRCCYYSFLSLGLFSYLKLVLYYLFWLIINIMAPKDNYLHSFSTQLNDKNYVYWSYVTKNFLYEKHWLTWNRKIHGSLVKWN